MASRMVMVFLALCLALGTVGANLFRRQILQGPTLQQRARERQSQRSRALAERRSIVDRNGELVAFDDRRLRIWAHPNNFRLMGDPPHQLRSRAEISALLAPLLPLTRRELERRMAGRVSGIRLVENLDAELARSIAQLGISGIDLEFYPYRTYPQGPAFANVVGFLDSDRRPQAGLELSQNRYLERPERNQLRQFSATGQLLPRDLAPGSFHRDELQLQLTIDGQLQRIAHQALSDALKRWKASRGAVIVMDVRDGSLLAISSAPGYDPSRFWVADPKLYREWSVEDLFEPGSTFKPINLAIALQEGAIEADSTVVDKGYLQIGGWPLFNHDRKANGTIDMAKVLQVSSNIGMVQVMSQLSADVYWQWLDALGIAATPDTDLPGAQAGMVKPRKLFTTQPIEPAVAAFGQGFSLTALKLLQLHAVIANGGRMVSPHITRGLRDAGDVAAEGQAPGRQIFDPGVTALVSGWMESVVTDGSGRAVAMPGYRIAGKTGTAQKAENGAYRDNAVIASFVAHLPVESPRFALLVVIDEPKGPHVYGSSVAAPIAARLIDQLVLLQQLPPNPTAAEAELKLEAEAGGRPADLPAAATTTNPQSIRSLTLVPNNG